MFCKVRTTLFLLMGIVFSASCTPRQGSLTPEANMPNPASVHCEQNGGKLDLRHDASGGVVGMCVFPDGNECEEWAYFRSECNPGNVRMTIVPTAFPAATEVAPTAVVELASDGWKIYRNEKLGYGFHYPVDATVVPNDEPLRGLSIIGPLIGTDNWPQFTISHPSDREEYRPPEDVDLAQWLMGHNLLSAGGNQSTSEIRQPDTQIAGMLAIHTRFERSPQSYAYDRYYFAKSGQLYMIVISHSGDKEDWEVYNRFLESIQFAH